ncbi:hypothetical protein [Streptomyces sp. NPDC058240]|uniref:hypothetical protein n=1 Tax=Streptomyces sp. NPDC058240 TaxID=3346396 RepID=UPI0036EC3B07
MNAIETVEFLYAVDSSVADDSRFYEPPRVVRFRITRKTPKRIYYVRREDGLTTSTGFVDRQRIEADGEIYSRTRGWWAPDFHLYLSPPELEQATKPDLASLRAAMAAAHPDRGGTEAGFITARQRYEDARTKAQEITA